MARNDSHIAMNVAREIAEQFYRNAQQDATLHPFFPGSLRCAIEGLSAFLTQFLGGPNEYSQIRSDLSLREAHLRFKIDEAARQAWLRVMDSTLKEIAIDISTKDALLTWFEGYSKYLVNTAADETPCIVGRIQHPEIAQRAHEQHIVEQLVEAARQSDADEVLKLTAQLESLLKRDPATHLSILELMSRSGDPSLNRHAVEVIGGDTSLIEQRYMRGKTLLHGASAAGSLLVVQMLLDKGADPNALDDAGHAPLYCVANQCAAKSGPAIVHALVKAGADLNANKGSKRCTALHMAARRGFVEIAAALLDCGAQIDAKDSNGQTPLRRSRNCRKPNVAALLVASGAVE